MESMFVGLDILLLLDDSNHAEPFACILRHHPVHDLFQIMIGTCVFRSLPLQYRKNYSKRVMQHSSQLSPDVFVCRALRLLKTAVMMSIWSGAKK